MTEFAFEDLKVQQLQLKLRYRQDKMISQSYLQASVAKYKPVISKRHQTLLVLIKFNQ